VDIVHRAARASAASPGLTSGLSRQLAAAEDYYRVQTRGKLPVRWMAVESLAFCDQERHVVVWCGDDVHVRNGAAVSPC
jgi:hypothetical protein